MLDGGLWGVPALSMYYFKILVCCTDYKFVKRALRNFGVHPSEAVCVLIPIVFVCVCVCIVWFPLVF
jgi:hypothetical protein